MIVFGSGVSDRQVYERIALPSVRRVAEPDSRILVREGRDSIQAPYNEMMDEAAALADLEALVLIHQDLELTDDSLLERVRSLLRDSRTGLIGALGACDVAPHRWLEPGALYGTSMAPGIATRHSVGAHEVVGVDGSLLVVAPWAVRTLRFSERLAESFHGYDADFSFRVRASGGRVMCDDIPYFHHMSRSWDDAGAVAQSACLLAEMWDPALRPPEWAPAFQR